MRAICLFGFIRNGNGDEFNKVFPNADIYLATPKQVFEDKNIVINRKEIKKRYPNLEYLFLWDYDKKRFQKMVPKFVPKFNKWYQQAWRIYSQFYHIKKSVERIIVNPDKKYDYVIVTRPDLRILGCDDEKIRELLLKKKNDIIVRKKNGKTGYTDHFFIVKPEHLTAIYNIFDNYTLYLREYYQGKVNLPSWRPEDIWYYHLNNKLKLKVVCNEVVKYDFTHVCSRYCGHHKKETKS